MESAENRLYWSVGIIMRVYVIFMIIACRVELNLMKLALVSNQAVKYSNIETKMVKCCSCSTLHKQSTVTVLTQPLLHTWVTGQQPLFIQVQPYAHCSKQGHLALVF